MGLEPWLFASLETTLPVVPAGNSLNCLRSSPVINNGRLLNMYQIVIVKLIGNRSNPPIIVAYGHAPEVAKTSFHPDCRKIKPCSVVVQRRTLSCAAADKLSNCRPHLRQRCSTAVNSLQNGRARLRTFSSRPTVALRKTQYFCTVSRYQQLFGLT